MSARKPIRVLVVDDAVVIRKIVTGMLAEDPEIEVVGTAANGSIALSRIETLKPDVVTLDVEMPEMDGIQTLKEIRKRGLRLPVIMFSTLTERGAAATLDALTYGASDYVTKPANVGSVGAALNQIREQLIPKIKQFARGGPALAPHRQTLAPRVAPALAPSAAPTVAPTAPRVGGMPLVLAIGVSTGGPNALAELLPALPGSLPVPVLITQHMPPVFTKLLADRLNSQCALSVKEAEEGDVLRAGCAYVAPGDYHMTVARRGNQVVLNLNQQPPQHSCRPAVDVMLRSIVQAYGASTLAVILTGMGHDGLLSCQEVKKAGGQVLAQDEASSVVWGMPGMVAKAGIADRVVALGEMGAEITRRLRMQPGSFRSGARAS